MLPRSTEIQPFVAPIRPPPPIQSSSDAFERRFRGSNPLKMPLSVEEGGTPIAPSARCRRVKRPAGKLAKSSVHDKDAEIQRRFIVIRSAHPMPNDMMRPAWRARSRGRAERRTRPTSTAPRAHQPGGPAHRQPTSAVPALTLKKLDCSKGAYAPYTLAWDNIIGFRSYCVGVRDQSDAQRHAEGDVVPKDEDAPRGVHGRRRQRHARAPAGRAWPSPGGLARSTSPVLARIGLPSPCAHGQGRHGMRPGDLGAWAGAGVACGQATSPAHGRGPAWHAARRPRQRLARACMPCWAGPHAGHLGRGLHGMRRTQAASASPAAHGQGRHGTRAGDVGTVHHGTRAPCTAAPPGRLAACTETPRLRSPCTKARADEPTTCDAARSRRSASMCHSTTSTVPRILKELANYIIRTQSLGPRTCFTSFS